jgi:O-antigen ligase
MDTPVSAPLSAVPETPAPAPPAAQNLWLSIYVAVVVGQFSQWVPGLADLPLAKAAILITALFAFRARATLRAVRLRSLTSVRPALAYLALAILSIGFSSYLSMSLAAVYLIVVILLSFVLVLKITQTQRDVRRLLVALCFAAGGLTLAVLLTYSGGRARINENFDSNDLAYAMVTVLPVIRAVRITGTKGRLILQGLSVAVIIAILLTGSRGGAIGLGVVILLLVAFPIGFAKTGELKRFRLGRFVVVLALIATVGAGLWGYLPQDSRERMATLLDLKNDYNAGDSSASRSAIWLRNSAAVLSRPIGYGLGTSEYVDGLTGGAYRALHNSFVESLVELGVLGLVLFCASYWVTIRQLGRVSALGRGTAPTGDTAKACVYARALRIALVGNAVSGFFLSQSYSELLWTLMAICAALVRITLPAPTGAATPQART